MNRNETIAILGILKIAYPKFYANMTKQEAEQTINLWQEMFSEDDAKSVSIAVKALITTLQFPPTIADVKNELYKLLAAEEKSDIELWNELKDALRSGIYGCVDIFPRLSKELQLYLKNPMQLKELATMDMDEVDTVQKGIFLKQMPIIKQREKEKMMMLPERKKMFQELAEKMSVKYLNGDVNN